MLMQLLFREVCAATSEKMVKKLHPDKAAKKSGAKNLIV